MSNNDHHCWSLNITTWCGCRCPCRSTKGAPTQAATSGPKLLWALSDSTALATWQSMVRWGRRRGATTQAAASGQKPLRRTGGSTAWGTWRRAVSSCVHARSACAPGVSCMRQLHLGLGSQSLRQRSDHRRAEQNQCQRPCGIHQRSASTQGVARL
jgi:hypothetical protein